MSEKKTKENVHFPCRCARLLRWSLQTMISSKRLFDDVEQLSVDTTPFWMNHLKCFFIFPPELTFKHPLLSTVQFSESITVGMQNLGSDFCTVHCALPTTHAACLHTYIPRPTTMLNELGSLYSQRALEGCEEDLCMCSNQMSAPIWKALRSDAHPGTAQLERKGTIHFLWARVNIVVV